MGKYLLGISLFFLLFNGFAQQRIEGLIVDENDQALGFAHAYNRTLQVGHVSNISGRFQLLAQKGDTIRFSYVGYNATEIVLESIHLGTYLKVKLTEDSLLLPSITIYSDRYYKVPFNYQGESMEIDGIAKPSGEPIKPGSIGGPSSGGIGLTLYGPITFFSKDAKEQRMAEAAYEETSQTIFYQKFIESDTVRKKICEIYHIEDAEYDRLLISAHLTNPEVQKIRNANDLWYWLLFYFKGRVSY